MNIPQDLKYTASHEWLRLGGDGIATVGITDHAQEQLGDVVFVELPEVGEIVAAGSMAATVESVKAAEDVISPVSGEVIEVNSALEGTPEIVNERPYETWFYRVQPAGTIEAELAALLGPDEYEQFMDEAAH